MSIRSLSALAVERDEAKPHKRKGAGAAQAPLPQTWADGIIAAIPSEVLAIYTAIVGVIVAAVETGGNNHFWLRWALYAVGIAAVAVWLTASYVRQRPHKKRHLPLAELTAASIAFAGWGLVMPGSPLSLSLGKDNREIWTAIITGATVFLLGMLGVPLKEKAGK